MKAHQIMHYLPKDMGDLPFNEEPLRDGLSSIAFVGVPKAGKEDRVQEFSRQYNRTALSSGDAVRAFQAKLLGDDAYKISSIVQDYKSSEKQHELTEILEMHAHAVRFMSSQGISGLGDFDYAQCARAVLQMKNGDNVNDEAMMKIYADQFAENHGPYSLDGYLRGLSQVPIVHRSLEEHYPLEGIVFVYRNKEFILDESQVPTRRICDCCNFKGNILSDNHEKRPTLRDVDGTPTYVCPEGSPVTIRDDDDPSTVRRRVTRDAPVITDILRFAHHEMGLKLWIVPGLVSEYSDERIYQTLHNALSSNGFAHDWDDYSKALDAEKEKVARLKSGNYMLS